MTTEATRKVIEDWLAALTKVGPREAFERYAVEDLILHNPTSGKGREGAIAYMEDEIARGGAATVLRVIVENDLAIVHKHMTFQDESPELAIVDLWRVENGKLAELWDVPQPVPATTASGNSMF